MDGYDTLWVAVDALTKYPIVEAMRSKSAKDVVDQLGKLITIRSAKNNSVRPRARVL